ncbi:hypothetical protein AB0R12_39405, partial [Streptomyces niveus]
MTIRGDHADIGVPEEVAERILTPLLDNARRYARHTVTVRCAAGTGRITLYVGDDGPSGVSQVNHIIRPVASMTSTAPAIQPPYSF